MAMGCSAASMACTIITRSAKCDKSIETPVYVRQSVLGTCSKWNARLAVLRMWKFVVA